MKVLILAAGFSTRLYPLTKNFPKALLEVGGKPIIEYLTDELVQISKIDEMAIVSNKRYLKLFEHWLDKKYPTKTIKLISNQVTSPETRLGAVYDLKFGLERLNWYSDQVMVLASDTVAAVKIRELIDYSEKNIDSVVNVVYNTKDTEDIKNKLGCVQLDGESIIKFWEKPEKPETTFTSVPYYIFPPEALKLIKVFTRQNLKGDSPGYFIAWLMGKYPVIAYKIDNYYYDSNTIESYNKLKEMVGDHRLKI